MIIDSRKVAALIVTVGNKRVFMVLPSSRLITVCFTIVCARVKQNAVPRLSPLLGILCFRFQVWTLLCLHNLHNIVLLGNHVTSHFVDLHVLKYVDLHTLSIRIGVKERTVCEHAVYIYQFDSRW